MTWPTPIAGRTGARTPSSAPPATQRPPSASRRRSDRWRQVRCRSDCRSDASREIQENPDPTNACNPIGAHTPNPHHPEGVDSQSKSSLSRYKKPGHVAPRRGRIATVGQLYLVNFSTHRRQPLFFNHRLAMDAAGEIHDPRSWQRAKLLAWVLMLDHWHGLIELGEGQSLPDLMRALKGNVSRRLRLRWPALGPRRAKSFHDRALRRGEDASAAARYIVLNPLRAGLARRVRDYPSWDAVWL
ncbi:MAG: transposase [Pseudoxanthomonas sp.]